VLLRFEFGWGPWPALDMTRVCDWDINITLEGGLLENVQTCFQSGPLDEARRDKILERSGKHLRVQSFTALRQQFEDISTKAVVLKIRGGPDTRVKITLRKPTNVSLSQTFSQLAQSGEMLFTGDFPKESAMVHRLVFHNHYYTSYKILDTDDADTHASPQGVPRTVRPGKGLNWYYLRATQANNQVAWSSPIWVEPRAT